MGSIPAVEKSRNLYRMKSVAWADMIRARIGEMGVRNGGMVVRVLGNSGERIRRMGW